jgi:carboxyl-terminal processing protease
VSVKKSTRNCSSSFQLSDLGHGALGRLLLLATTSLAFNPAVSAAKPEQVDDLFKELKPFTDTLAIVKRDYVREVTDKELVEGAIKGMLAVLDPHSGYLDPDFYKDLKVQTKGEFGGLGLEISQKDGLLSVVSPMEGSPAEKAGVRAGDVIVKIDGKFTKDLSLPDAVKRLRGPKGSTVSVSVSRKGQSKLMEFSLVRDRIQVDSVKSRYLGEGYGYVRISQFMERTSDDVIAALKSLKDTAEGNTMKGVILDVRNNPGGLLTQAVRLSDIFLDEGVVVYTQGRIDSQKQKFFAHEKGTEPDYPIVILVNGGSASASEILAGALKDHGRAVIVGTQTFGKGSVQTITPLDNGGALTLTTALYYTKSGNSLQASGVAPDIEVKDEFDIVEDEKGSVPLQLKVREGDLPGAITNPDGATDPMQKINQTPTVPGEFDRVDPETTNLKDWYKKDRQMAKAVDVLHSFSMFAKGGVTTPDQVGAVRRKFSK